MSDFMISRCMDQRQVQPRLRGRSGSSPTISSTSSVGILTDNSNFFAQQEDIISDTHSEGALNTMPSLRDLEDNQKIETKISLSTGSCEDKHVVTDTNALTIEVNTSKLKKIFRGIKFFLETLYDKAQNGYKFCFCSIKFYVSMHIEL